MSDPAILVLNAGSSSIKFALFASGAEPSRHDRLCDGECVGIGHEPRLMASDHRGMPLISRNLPLRATHEEALAILLDWLSQEFSQTELVAVGHRVVHGGRVYTEPVRIDDAVVENLRRLVPLAPLHQPHHLATIASMHPDVLQVACFDTAFHRTQSAIETMYALPRALSEEGIRRYGFHGLSYEYIASVLPEIVGSTLAEGRVVVAHLGSGASMCAMYRRKSVATTMGFTALDGLPMAQRCGALDPGVVLYLMQEKGMSAAAIADVLYRQSGLLGVSGISDDMQVLLTSNDEHGRAAVDLFVYRIARELGSLAAVVGGLDALVFTAGIGENEPEIRRRVCEHAAWLGIAIDNEANERHGPRITSESSKTSAWVIPTDEDLMIARHTWAVLSA
ncbi:MAG: acetate/propionate family kinase [Rudaea sp.]